MGKLLVRRTVELHYYEMVVGPGGAYKRYVPLKYYKSSSGYQTTVPVSAYSKLFLDPQLYSRFWQPTERGLGKILVCVDNRAHTYSGAQLLIASSGSAFAHIFDIIEERIEGACRGYTSAASRLKEMEV